MSDVSGKVEKSTNTRDRAYRFSLTLIKFLNTLPTDRRFFVFYDQLVRAGTSIGANIYEAKAASSRKDFTNFYQISLKSSYETVYWLELLRDSYPTFNDSIDPLLKEANELCKMLGSSVLSLKSHKSSTSDI